MLLSLLQLQCRPVRTRPVGRILDILPFDLGRSAAVLQKISSLFHNRIRLLKKSLQHQSAEDAENSENAVVENAEATQRSGWGSKRVER